MLANLRQHLTYANVMSTLAVFIALGGSSYAAFQIGSSNIANNSVRGVDVRDRTLDARDIKRNSLGGRSIKESRLGRVPLARDADRLSGMTAAEFLVRCPSGTFPIADVCVETTARQPAPYGTATIQCASSGTPAGPGKRLPTHGELLAALSGVQLAGGGELTSEVLPSSTEGQLDVLFIIDQGGRVGVTPGTFAGAKAYRCVSDPLN